MAKNKLELSCISNINVCLRKRNITASDVLKDSFISSLINHNDGFKVLNQVCSSPTYWESKKNLFCMIRQHGKRPLKVCVFISKKSKKLNRHILYVALSRVTKISGLFVLSTVKSPHPPPIDDDITAKLTNLRENKQLIVISSEVSLMMKTFTCSRIFITYCKISYYI